MKKKLIIFIPSIEEGGVEKNLYIIANYLIRKDLDVKILTCNHNKRKHFNNRVKIIGTKSNFWFNKSRTVKYIICLLYLFFYLLKKKEKHLIFAFQANIYAIIISKILGTNIITRSNTSPSGWSKNFFKKIIYKFLINRANEVMVNSIDFKREFSKNFNINVECIYNPFDKLNVLKKLKQKKNNNIFKKNSLKIISVGRLTDQKDHITLIKSVKLINKKINPDIKIIGKGVNFSFLKEYIYKNNLNNLVELVGYKAEPFDYIKKADILILTSKFEGLPNILIEGQFLKKYIISTDCPTGPKEILMNGKAGDLFKVGDFKKLAKLINDYPYKLKSISKKIKYGSKNFFRFDYKINCKKYYDLINRNF